MHTRLAYVDVIRGLAIIGVVLFHLVWDLEFAGFIFGIASHPAWLFFGNTLAGTFMLLVGVSLVLGHSTQIRWPAFWYRLAVIISAAAVITLLTWFVFPQAFIYYGILHSIAVASLAGVLFIRAPIWLCFVAGVFILMLPEFVSSSTFDTRWLAWSGLFITPPTSNDFVPFFPWAGLTFLGMALAKMLRLNKVKDATSPAIKRSQTLRWIGWTGRKSLPIYLIHQPVLLAVIIPAAWWLIG